MAGHFLLVLLHIFKLTKDDPFLTRALASLKEKRFRITSPRQMVLELLSKTKKALHPNDIYSEIKKSAKSIDLASVYRILEVLTELKLIHREANGGYFPCQHCAKCPSSVHIFINCFSCGNLKELDYHGEVFGDAFIKRLKTLAINSEQETIYLQSTCSDCR